VLCVGPHSQLRHNFAIPCVALSIGVEILANSTGKRHVLDQLVRFVEAHTILSTVVCMYAQSIAARGGPFDLTPEDFFADRENLDAKIGGCVSFVLHSDDDS